MNIYLRSVISVDYDLVLIDRFINHYKKLGVNKFLITLNTTPGKTGLTQALNILSKHNISPMYIWRQPYKDVVRTRYLDKMVNHLRDDDWIITADCDEFIRLTTGINYILNLMDEEGSNYARGYIIDRLRKDYTIPETLDARALEDQFPIECNMQKLKTKNEYMEKIPIHRKYIKLSLGNHNIQKKYFHENCYKSRYAIDHFKWFGNVQQKIEHLIRHDYKNNKGKIPIINGISSGKIKKDDLL